MISAPPGAPRCPEIDCVRAYLPWQVIAAAERRAEEIGLGADRVLIAEGTIDEDRYLAALATRLGTAYERLDRVPRAACPLSDEQLIEAAVAGLLPLHIAGELVWVVAPRNLAARTVTNLIAGNPWLARRIRLTSTAQLNRFIARHGRQSLGSKADRALVEKWPELSAAPQRWRPSIAMIAAAVVFAAVFYAFPDVIKTAIEAALALGFLAWLLLRLAGSFITPPRVRPVRVTERGLPVYTVIVALYREAASVEGLVAALRELDYPPEKLDIKLVIEPDDRETRLALERLELGPPFEIIVAPPVGPRTKPKALDAALAFARGTFTAVYDAEDRPDPDQLRRVLDVFLSTGDDVACVQASLTIDNTGDSWLTRMFTAEYAAQFDLFLPGLAALELPLPLGGYSVSPRGTHITSPRMPISV